MLISTHKHKILNDPVYGFISIPHTIIFDLIAHPYFQRLRRITQMGLSYLVYPGAHHTRFSHAIGCMHLMQRTIAVLRSKNVVITEKESTALSIAILLHDIGHGPFSHTLEHSIVKGFCHEHISLQYMRALNKIFKGDLDLAIDIFENKYSKKFFYQLISSQLDMDRLDYLKRDSFYTGVAEGNINSERLIDVLAVHQDQLVVEQKGIYSVEQFLVGRRLMHWQVYLHKISLVAERMLINLLNRAKELSLKGIILPCADALRYFLKGDITDFNQEVLQKFSLLDDSDILSAIKTWITHKDFVLSTLSKMIINRILLQIEFLETPLSKQEFLSFQAEKMKQFDISIANAHYFIFQDKAQNIAYSNIHHNIYIRDKNNKIMDIARACDQSHLSALSEKVIKYYVCYPKDFLDKI